MVNSYEVREEVSGKERIFTTVALLLLWTGAIKWLPYSVTAFCFGDVCE